MSFIVGILEKTATKAGLIVLAIVYAAVFGGILITLNQLTKSSSGFGILDFDFGYSRERVMEVLGSYGDTGWSLYSRIQLLDLINPALYSLLLASIIFLLWRSRNTLWVVVIPLFAGLLDYLENLTLFLLSQSYPSVSSGLVSISSNLSIIKNVALYATVFILILGILLRLKGYFTTG